MLCARLLGRDRIANIRPVEAADEQRRVAQTQPLDDVLTRGFGSGRGQGNARHIRKFLGDRPEVKIVRPKVMAPLGHAMRLIDSDQD